MSDQTRFHWASAEDQFPEGWRLFVIVIETMTNPLLSASGWRVGLPVRITDDRGYGGASFALVDPESEGVQNWLSRSDAERVIAICGKHFMSVTFRVLEFVQVAR